MIWKIPPSYTSIPGEFRRGCARFCSLIESDRLVRFIAYNQDEPDFWPKGRLPNLAEFHIVVSSPRVRKSRFFKTCLQKMPSKPRVTGTIT